MDPDGLALFPEVAGRSPAEREAYDVAHHIDVALPADVESPQLVDGQTAEFLDQRVVPSRRACCAIRQRLLLTQRKSRACTARRGQCQ
jgi:hypothetical protein